MTHNEEYVERFGVLRDDQKELEIEYVERDDWSGLSDPCPDCGAIEFHHVRYDGGHYSQYQGAVIQRKDYWFQKGSLYTACLECDEVLYKNPAYDLLEAFENGEFP